MGTWDSLVYADGLPRAVISAPGAHAAGHCPNPQLPGMLPEDAFSPLLGGCRKQPHPRSHLLPEAASSQRGVSMVVGEPGPLARLETRLKGHLSPGLPGEVDGGLRED